MSKMEVIFTELEVGQHNRIGNLVKWFQEAKLVDKGPKGENKVRALFSNPTKEELVEFEAFKEAVRKLAQEQMKPFEEISKILAEEGPRLMALVNLGVTTVKDTVEENMKKTKLVEATKEGEEKARALFAGADQRNIDFSKFREVVEKLANEQKKSFEEFSKQLAEEGPKLMQSAMAGVAALKDKFMK